jgi:PAS domain S-box-containing protein
MFPATKRKDVKELRSLPSLKYGDETMKDQGKTKKQLSDELLKTRQQLEECVEVLDGIPDVIYKIDPEGHLLYINSSVENLGYSPEELIGKHFSTIIHPDDVAYVSRSTVLPKYEGKVTGEKNSPKLFDERRTGKRATRNLPIRLVPKNWKKQEGFQNTGSSKSVCAEVMASGQYDREVSKKDKTFLGTVGTIRDIQKRKQDEGRASIGSSEITYAEICSSGQHSIEVTRTSKKRQGTVGTIRDITERRRVEQQKAKLEERIQRARKMEAIGQLAGGIAHDFNNLLMGIHGNVSLMLMNMDSKHPNYERLKNIEGQVETGAELTSQLLGYARKAKYEVMPIDLNRLLVETSETLGRTRKEITISSELAEDLSSIEADSSEIEQVLLNLFVNAADAMPGGGDLILKTTNTTHNHMKGKPYDPKPGNYVLLTVTDTGTGIDKETLERIFDPFFTTKQRGRGTGLGLASAYGIIKGHSGYIDVDSKRGQGTTFSIYLPASEKRVQEAVKTAEKITWATGTVLLVDDEEIILEVGQDLLKTMGYQVLIAKHGKEAIEIYRKKRDDIDIVVLDMVMPNMGGGEAYDRLKEINPDIKVLLSSGFSIDGEATEILQRGCNGFVQKPFRMNELAEKITRVLDRK